MCTIKMIPSRIMCAIKMIPNRIMCTIKMIPKGPQHTIRKRCIEPIIYASRSVSWPSSHIVREKRKRTCIIVLLDITQVNKIKDATISNPANIKTDPNKKEASRRTMGRTKKYNHIRSHISSFLVALIIPSIPSNTFK